MRDYFKVLDVSVVTKNFTYFPRIFFIMLNAMTLIINFKLEIWIPHMSKNVREKFHRRQKKLEQVSLGDLEYAREYILLE